MFGKASHLSPLESRKRLLVAESELNRAHLSMEWRVFAAEVRVFTDQARTLAAWSSTAAMLIRGFAADQRKSASANTENPSCFQKVLMFAQLANRILQAFRAVFPRRPATERGSGAR